MTEVSLTAILVALIFGSLALYQYVCGVMDRERQSRLFLHPDTVERLVGRRQRHPGARGWTIDPQ